MNIILIHTCSDCEMEPWWDMRRGSVKLSVCSVVQTHCLKRCERFMARFENLAVHENTSNQYNFHMLFSLCYFTLHVYFKTNLLLLSMVLVLV